MLTPGGVFSDTIHVSGTNVELRLSVFIGLLRVNRAIRREQAPRESGKGEGAQQCQCKDGCFVFHRFPP